jgi:serine O-acetyltransferase
MLQITCNLHAKSKAPSYTNKITITLTLSSQNRSHFSNHTLKLTPPSQQPQTTTLHRTMPTGELRSPPKSTNNSTATAVIGFEDEGWLWSQIKAEARRDAESEPALASYLYSTILSHASLERSLSFHLGNKLCSSTLLSTLLYDLFLNAFATDPSLSSAAVADLRAARERDPACISYSHCLLNYKGFLACQVYLIL